MTKRHVELPGWSANPTQLLAPMMTGAARANMEMATLASRRAQAYLDLPNTLAQCRGPQDLFAAQTRFWQQAFEDYTASGRRIVAALSAQNAVAKAGDELTSSGRERDTLTFPDVFNPWALPESVQRPRDSEDRAA